MSLDVYLYSYIQGKPGTEQAIYIREDGQVKKISRSEWDDRYPGQEPICAPVDNDGEVYWANITHNLGAMAHDAGIYKHLWRPDEIGITTAAQLIDPLEAGLALLKSNPARFQEHNPSNGWGDYVSLVCFVEAYLAACKQYPDAVVHVDR